MASIIDMSGVHMSVLSEFTNFKCDFAIWKGSLKCCNKCLWITHWLHYCLISLNSWSFGWNSILMIMSMCTSIVCCRISGFCLCTHSLHHPWLSAEGSGVSSHPLWSEGVRRIGFVVCCAETRGYIAGLENYSPAPHSSRANGRPTVQCCQLSGWMCCAPAEMVSWSVWWCCEVEGQLF